jgi:broad specificity phosphatase PhoE
MVRWQLFIRHAHRDTEDRALDNGLSEKGRRQCEELVDELDRARPSRKPTRVLTSPKLRCRETAEFVAAWAGVKLEIDERLDEQGPRETEKTFLKRVEEFYEKTRRDPGVAFVSHGDVLPLLAQLGGLGRVDVKKAGYFWLTY